MNIRELLGCHILLVTCLSHVTLADSINSTNVTIGVPFQPQLMANVTWIKIQTLDPNHQLSCQNNCSTIVDDEERSGRKKRRKRRRNRKPNASANRYPKTWTNRRPAATSEQQYSRKKYSTRVHLDKPVQFVDHFIPPIDNPVSELQPPNSATVAAAVETTAMTFVAKIAPPPLRFLLPPFVDQYFVGNAATATSELGRKKPVTYELPPNNRGLTKFKNTVYYDDNGDLFNNEILQYTTPIQNLEGNGRREQKSKFKPIVVAANELQTNATSQEGLNFSRIESSSIFDRVTPQYVTSELAKAGMKAITMNDVATLFVPNENLLELTTDSYQSSYSYRDQHRETISEQPAPETEQNFQGTVEGGPSDYQPMRDEPNKYTGQQIRDYQQSSRKDSNDERQWSPWNYRQKSNGNYSTWTNQITSKSNSKGLELAESNYFPDLPSIKEEVQSSSYDNNQVIPGKAGKDYPIFSQTFLPRRRFACRGLHGYFADLSTRCQVFYICNGNGAGEPMLCPNGTLFSQELLVCDWWYNVEC